MYDPALGKDVDFDDLDPSDAEAAVERLRAEWVRPMQRSPTWTSTTPSMCAARPFSVRMTYLHMIAEYARHNGHADLLRESIDGTTGR